MISNVTGQGQMRMVLVVLALTGCSALKGDHSNDPKTCRERAAYRIAIQYTDPVVLGRALDVICLGAQDPLDTTPVVPGTLPVVVTAVP